MNGVNIKSSENKMLSEYAWKNESVAQKLHVQDDKCMKIGYNENNRVAQQIKVVQRLITYR